MKSLYVMVLTCLSAWPSHALHAMVEQVDHSQEIAVARTQALLELGIRLHRSRRYAQAREYLEEAAAQVLDTKCATKACLVLGNIYYFGIGIEKDCEKARKYFYRLAHQEEDLESQVEACRFLWELYFYGRGCTKDEEKSREFLNKAQQLRAHLKAEARAKWMCRYDAEKNLQNESSHSVSAEYVQEVPVARAKTLVKLAKLLIQSKEYDSTLKYLYKFALNYLEEAANQLADQASAAEARVLLGEIHAGWRLYGLLHLNELEKARLYFEATAVQQEDLAAKAQACFHLAVLYLNGELQGGINYEKARMYFEQAADQQKDLEVQAWAFLRLGQMWSGGCNMLDDEKSRECFEKGREYFERAASQKEDLKARAGAIFALGKMYCIGLGVQKNEARSRAFVEQAANQGENFDGYALAATILEELEE